MDAAILDFNPLPVWVCHSDSFKVSAVNAAVIKFFGYQDSFWINNKLATLFNLPSFNFSLNQENVLFTDLHGVSHTLHLSTKRQLPAEYCFVMAFPVPLNNNAPNFIRGERQVMSDLLDKLSDGFVTLCQSAPTLQMRPSSSSLTGRKLDHIVHRSYNEIYIFHESTLVFEYANESALRNLGYSSHELLSMKMTDLFHYPNEMALHILLKTLKKKETDRLKLQMKHQRKDGSYYDIETLIQYSPDENVFVAISTDISEKIATEKRLLATIAEKDILLKQIHHRLKNNLQLISSIIYFRSASFPDKEVRIFLDDVREKIHSVALIHERLLHNGRLDEVEISDYLGKLTADLQISAQRYGKQINFLVSLDKCFVDIDSAMYCALAVIELVTYSVRYAFKNSNTGEIQIELNALLDNIMLTVTDNGEARFHLHQSTDIDRDLLSIFVKQLSAVMDVQFNNGTRVQITFKRKK